MPAGFRRHLVGKLSEMFLTVMGVNATGTLAGLRSGCAPFQKIYEFFVSKWCDTVHSGCVVFLRFMNAVFRSPAEGKKIKHLSKYWESSTQDDPCSSNIGGRDPCNPCGVDTYACCDIV